MVHRLVLVLVTVIVIVRASLLGWNLKFPAKEQRCKTHSSSSGFWKTLYLLDLALQMIP
jgi:hypothetical protein